MGSERLSTPSVTDDNMADLPGYCALTFRLIPVGSTSQRSVQVLGFASIGPLTPLRRLYPLPVRQASALPTASSRFHLAMDTLAVRLTLPLAGCVGDLHLLVSAPCRAHKDEGPEPLLRAFACLRNLRLRLFRSCFCRLGLGNRPVGRAHLEAGKAAHRDVLTQLADLLRDQFLDAD